MQATNRRNVTVAALSIIAALALAAAAAMTPSGPAPMQANLATADAAAPMVGVATGEVRNGMHVYRLPPVAVVASRSVELAKIAQEERLASK